MIVKRALLALWFFLLLLPLTTVLPLANGWEVPPWHIALASIWIVSCAFVALPRRFFLILTYPLLLAGIVIVAADVLRSANLLELLSVRYTFNDSEIADAVMPYAGYLAVTAAALLALLGLIWMGDDARRGTLIWAQALVVLTGSGLVFALDKNSWRNAWPTVLAEPLIEGHIGDGGLGLPSMANVRVSPRDRFESWQASRESAPGTSETYVLVIGESVRSDRLAACGGRPQVSAPPEGSVIFCDMLSGSSGTHTSVPLLVSRNLPGTRNRVPRDATMLRAFEAVGFETFWLSAQERSIAWPDAKNQAYEPALLDRDALLPLLDQALARSSSRKLIVLHANNAHAPYLRRYREASAPFPVDVSKIQGGVPTKQTLDEWWNAYDNAVDESMRFLQEVIARVHAQPGMSVVVFTPDHGENMLDDARGLTQHALKMPTLWDTAVPAIIWTNTAWRELNADKWRMLVANRNAPLMHMDIAPTMLGAAGVRYLDQRTEPVDLTARPVPSRTRYTQVRAGETVTLDVLRQQTQVR